MWNMFKKIKKNKIWDFPGGIHPPAMKEKSSNIPLRQIPLPKEFIVPLRQHRGPEGELSVRPGDTVLRGQPLTIGHSQALPVHAPTSGTIIKIQTHTTAFPSPRSEMCIFIESDGQDRWCAMHSLNNYQKFKREEIITRLHESGIAGLGGAGFPTDRKLRDNIKKVHTLIINAAECEPYITSDDRLIQEHAHEIVEGIRILAWILLAKRVLIGIEDNKLKSITSLKTAINNSTNLHVCVIPTKYPSGGAKQITKILTGKEVSHTNHTSDIGVLVQNVSTVFAIKRAIINGEPLTERVVTLSGNSLRNPGNIWARLGTPINHLLKHTGFTPENKQIIIIGGPLMGFTIPIDNIPLVKTINCIFTPSTNEIGKDKIEKNCIRCGICADACPALLLPQQLYWFSKGKEHEKARQYHINDCIECGACSYVCPSKIPLVRYFRQEKEAIGTMESEKQRAALAKIRFISRIERIEKENIKNKKNLC
ncbi:Electron transport complex subunit RsxC [Candidatus Erwinia haradaeae]|uniref:Ion-translocating oxidoreductase complex subunit C n=1 Tax=Candidatus Erwinia haradaeae TaxID=1922217 RepID=A0A451CZE9_9GAMM|nr:Electron transport complex subunit RsxC [Candidatus Erwinia haradaeae]